MNAPLGTSHETKLKHDSHSAELLQWKRRSNGYLMLPGNGKITYFALRILNEHCSTLASDKRPSLLFSHQNVYFKRIQIEPAKGIDFFLGGVLLRVRKIYLTDGD